jgi:hypothetical protein
LKEKKKKRRNVPGAAYIGDPQKEFKRVSGEKKLLNPKSEASVSKR